MPQNVSFLLPVLSTSSEVVVENVNGDNYLKKSFYCFLGAASRENNKLGFFQ